MSSDTSENSEIQDIHVPCATNRNCVIHGMDMARFVPNYLYVNSRTWKNGAVTYYLTNDTVLNIFINSLYEAIRDFMIYVGYEPTEIFPYIQVNYRKITKASIYRRRFYHRLGVEDKKIYVDPQTVGLAKILKARFFDNDPTQNWGFSLDISARNVQIHLLPKFRLCDHEGMEIPPQTFFREFLFNINYPIYIYKYQEKIGTLRRLKFAYDDMIYRKNKYESYNFPL